MSRSADLLAVGIESWWQLTAAEMAGVYAAERARYLDVLAWDTTATWAALEQARATRAVPGLVARDEAGAIAGWTYFVTRADELQIGAFTATAAARERRLDALLQTPEAGAAARLRLVGSTDAPDLARALGARGFLTGAYGYLHASLAGATAPAAGATATWRHGDLAATAALMRDAYAAPDPLRPFGGAGRADDWIDYVVGLTASPGCGHFAADLSVVVRSADGGLDAVALVTRLGAATAHLAQLAVAPAARGRGLGRRVLGAAMHRAADAGLAAMSLLVAADNGVARRLYDAYGFRHAASFVSAVADRRRRAPGL